MRNQVLGEEAESLQSSYLLYVQVASMYTWLLWVKDAFVHAAGRALWMTSVTIVMCDIIDQFQVANLLKL